MTPAPAPALPPGSLTVPPWSGWEWLLTGTLLVALLAVVAVAFLAVGRAPGVRPEWRAWLDARSAARRDAELRARSATAQGSATPSR